MSATICLIIPCYNEANRLDFGELARLPPDVTCLLVDDGSRDDTATMIRQHESASLRLLELGQNVGKAEAIRRGMLHARASGLLRDAAWVGYWDADLATPLDELDYFLEFAEMAHGTVDGILGSRVKRLGTRINRSFSRHLLGRLFATSVSAFLGLDSYDSQCGAKLFRPSLVERAFDRPFLSRWIFDVEVLMRLADCRLVECPVRRWTDVPGSKLRILRVFWTTVADLIRIRRHYGRKARGAGRFVVP
jgi:glycosyltransferase involved in cell wall biosynthesis